MRTKLNKACDLSSGSFFTPQTSSNVNKSCNLSSTSFFTPQSRSNLSKSCDFNSKPFCTPQFRKPNVPKCTQSKPGNTVSRPPKYKEVASGSVDPNVQVCVRVRPLSSMEISMYDHERCLKLESSQSITWIGQPETSFRFDYVADETVNQEMLFMMVGRPMVENCVSGYNSCMFAYGQAGSGKSYTMLGEIDDLEVKPSAKHGMTTRIFEFLFSKIQDEEKARRDEKLKHHCKCSFFEIYNEQITDLLDPSSTNLLPRKDTKKGVYVSNLSESEVHTGADIIKLLSQGTSNRKVEATNLNRESSRSHSVFTCVIESTWEKDTMTKVRFARLNLVDLAGSERQKTSGAEGERLKEASSINKSLFTLGHVIDILVDVANGKLMHVPYRDSRLTFLLQDSLGGNSKTMIIANVSPSICSAAATLSTLKFAQRAKLIENNVVVNEDVQDSDLSIMTCQEEEIKRLKDKISSLEKLNSNLNTALEIKDAKLKELEQSHFVIIEDLCSKIVDLETSIKKLDKIEADSLKAKARLKVGNDRSLDYGGLPQHNRRRKWTVEEVECLKNGVIEYGRQWSLIIVKNFEVFGKRTGQHLKDKYRNIEKAEERAVRAGERKSAKG